MIRRLFVYLSVALFLNCFITSCKDDSPKNDNTLNSNSKTTVTKKKKENSFIRDNKINPKDSLTDIETNSNLDDLTCNEIPSEDASDIKEEIDTRVYDIAEKMPEFPGGLDALQKYIKDKTSSLTTTASFTHTMRSMISFIVETDGSLTSPGVAKSSGNNEFDNEAIDIVLHMPAWIPAQNNGETVRMKYLIPVIFNPAQ